MALESSSIYQRAEMNRGAALSVLKRTRDLRDNLNGNLSLEKHGEQRPHSPSLASILDTTYADLNDVLTEIDSLIAEIGQAGAPPTTRDHIGVPMASPDPNYLEQLRRPGMGR